MREILIRSGLVLSGMANFIALILLNVHQPNGVSLLLTEIAIVGILTILSEASFKE